MKILLFKNLRDRPEDVGLPPVEIYRGEKIFVEDESRVTFKELWARVFRNKLLWYVSFANCFTLSTA